jgi:hypothetical protein
MKKFLILVCSYCILNNVQSQRIATESSKQYYLNIFDYDYVEKKPVFVAGKDSLRSFYLSHFTAYDSLVSQAILKGDTAKYIRVHFEYIIDDNGIPYNPAFNYIGSTRYAHSNGDKKIKYLNNLKEYFDKAIKQMIYKMPNWRPALQNNVRVRCKVEDYFQFWLGINPAP